ncbi:hypothetical protein CL1_1370 [Thermococcus cleftensis]|uniref:PIN domain-containing protein n=1 Tax=Thermococcus cleftensis (strain DSM 27260 / KACC 17922 / CL1) TaxID=163003 RepID=I3ZV35_THECF|nr:PIN domain-containing protein [Thermococcus cleftensis]AFL95569.1 hypothetical protein CL1_1370 [Thermococcus cleftensis]
MDSSVLLNVIFETELTERAVKLISLAEYPVISETVIDECVYVTLRRKASRKGVRSIYDLKRFLKREEGKALIRESNEDVLSVVASYGMEVVKDPDVFLALSLAERYGLLLHDAKILGSMVENGIRKLVTLDRDFEGIPLIEVIKENKNGE